MTEAELIDARLKILAKLMAFKDNFGTMSADDAYLELESIIDNGFTQVEIDYVVDKEYE